MVIYAVICSPLHMIWSFSDQFPPKSDLKSDHVHTLLPKCDLRSVHDRDLIVIWREKVQFRPSFGRNLPLLTLSRHQSAFGFFLRKNMSLLFQPMMKKKSIFWCFFSAYVCMELKVGFRKLRKKWGSSKDLISPSPLLLFLCFKKLRTTWTNIILTNSNIYLVLTG